MQPSPSSGSAHDASPPPSSDAAVVDYSTSSVDVHTPPDFGALYAGGAFDDLTD